MTKVQLTLKLSRMLSDDNLMQIARVHAVYGIFAARLSQTGDELFIEYDASRLNVKDVRAILDQHGIPIAA